MNHSFEFCISKKEKLLALLSFFLLSAVYVILASDTTSPLYATDPMLVGSADSGTFQIIGRYWLTEGILPYKYLFDQKGPFIFLFNGLGWLLTGNVHGICVFQALAISSYLYISYRTLRLDNDKFFSLISVLCSFFVMSMLYWQGNTVEEFNTPFMALSLLGFYRYTRQLEQDPSAEHEPRWAFVYGLCIAYNLLCRGSDALPVCLGVLVLGLHLIFTGKGLNLLKNLLCGILGLATVILPFVLYFGLHGALEDFWYGTIGFNAMYITKDNGFWLREATIRSMGKLCFLALPVLTMFASGVLALIRKKAVRGFLWIVMSLSAAAFYVSSRGYRHYLITFVPYLPVALSETKALMKELFPDLRIHYRRVLSGLLLTLVVIGGIQGRDYLTASQFFWRDNPEPYCMKLFERIPEEDRDRVVFYNLLASYYITADIRPCNKFFAFQDWQGRVSPVMMNQIVEELRECKAKWVLACMPVDPDPQAALDEFYVSEYAEGNLVLYRLNEKGQAIADD